MRFINVDLIVLFLWVGHYLRGRSLPTQSIKITFEQIKERPDLLYI